MTFRHTPVLFEEVIEGLGIDEQERTYIDGTIGGGGHAEAILKRGNTVLGIDQDEEAISHLKKKFESEIKNKKLILARGNFSDMQRLAEENNISGVDGILLDLGLSSYQLDESGRGFTFRFDEELDMRMDNRSEITAKEIVNKYSEDELFEIFLKYGEEPKARDYAKRIIDARKNAEIKTTKDLVDILGKGLDKGHIGGIHPVTRVFQALRIVVNDEIGNLKIGLDSGFKLLKGGVHKNSTGDGGEQNETTIEGGVRNDSARNGGEQSEATITRGGRLAVISFHSLEDRVVKLFFQRCEREGLAKLITKKPITASEEEVRINRRARSAKLRILERL